MPAGPYRVRITVGAHVWDVTEGDTPTFGVALPLTFGWQVPESVDFFPAQADRITGSFGLVVESVADVADITLGTRVVVEVWIPSNAATSWQRVVGVVSQLEATVGDRNLLTVFFTDPLLLLAGKVVGLVDWPEEHVTARVDRIAAEAGILVDRQVNLSGTGWLPERRASPTTALAALDNAFNDDADRQDVAGGEIIYGRPVFGYAPTTNTLYVRVWNRAVLSWPAVLAPDGTLDRRPGVWGALDGCTVEAGGRWSRLPADLPTYVIVDTLVFGNPAAPGAVPYVRNTAFTDPEGDPSDTARDVLGKSLLPPETSAAAWRTDTMRHLSHLDPDPVQWWFGHDRAPNPPEWDSMPWAEMGIRPVIVEPVDPALTLDGRDWIAGTLSGARFTLPAGGKHYVDLTLRPDLFDSSPYLSPTDPQSWDETPATLTWDGCHPALTWIDLQLAGA